MLKELKDITSKSDQGNSIELGERLVEGIDSISLLPNGVDKFKMYANLACDASFIGNPMWNTMWSEAKPYPHLIEKINKDVLSMRGSADKSAVLLLVSELMEKLPGIYKNIDELGQKIVTYGHFTILFECMKEAMLTLCWPDINTYNEMFQKFEKENAELVSFAS